MCLNYKMDMLCEKGGLMSLQKGGLMFLQNGGLKVALKILGQIFYKNTKNPSSRKPSNNRRN